MSKPYSPEHFAWLAQRAGLDRDKMGPERYEELREGTAFLARLQRSIRRKTAGKPRDRGAEPAHVFVHPRG